MNILILNFASAIRPLFCWLSFCLAVSGCSSRSTTFSVSLPTSGLLECMEILDPTEAQLSPRTYRCSASPQPIFTTVVKDCSLEEKFTTQATTRQLLIGFSGLKVLSQETVELGGVKALRSVVIGKLDLDDIQLATFTTRDGECVTDVAVWSGSSADKNIGIETDFVRSATKLAEVILSTFKAS